MMDLVAWHVDPCSHQAGFTPHRDRHLGLEEQDLGEVQAGFRQEHGCSPRDSTCWIALADAAPDNGQCSHLSTLCHQRPPQQWLRFLPCVLCVTMCSGPSTHGIYIYIPYPCMLRVYNECLLTPELSAVLLTGDCAHLRLHVFYTERGRPGVCMW